MCNFRYTLPILPFCRINLHHASKLAIEGGHYLIKLEANRLLYELSNDDSVWKEACKREWADKKHMVPFQLHPRADYSKVISSLSVEDMQNILIKRGVRGDSIPTT